MMVLWPGMRPGRNGETMDQQAGTYWALSGLGWGRGETPQEAVDNYVEAQMRNYPAKHTVFKTRPKFKAALTTGEVKPEVWKAPEGYDGFVTGMGAFWTADDKPNLPFAAEHQVDMAATAG